MRAKAKQRGTIGGYRKMTRSTNQLGILRCKRTRKGTTGGLLGLILEK